MVTFDEHIDRDAERVVFTINDRSYPDVPDIVTRVGATEVWDLVNASEMEHPFHLHGFFFQVVSRNGLPEGQRSWEDTIQLRGEERVRIAFRPDARPGHWMYHCHILEHVDNGMMATLRVEP
nr:multicopper oxidase domain-containing protein [Deltaproteobacteria bacterium]